MSVVIPTYNRARDLKEAIDSVLAQEWPLIEIIVVDDGSTDETPALLADYADRRGEILRVIRQENHGPSSARNAGILAARHEFIALLDSDDRWEPNKLREQMQMFSGEPAPDLTFTSYMAVQDSTATNSGQIFRATDGAPYDEVELAQWDGSQSFILERLLAGSCIHPSTVVARRSCLQASGLFDTTLRCAEDHDAWLRIAAAGYRIDYLQKRLTRSRIHPESESGDLALVSACTERVFERLFESGVLPTRFQQDRDFYLARSYLNSACRYLDMGEGKKAIRSLWRAARTCPRSIRPGWLRLALQAVVRMSPENGERAAPGVRP